MCLIGHCLGGAVVYLLAAAEPKRVRLLVLVLVLEEPALPLSAMPPREVPPRPDGTLSFDWRVVEAITQ